MDEVTRDADAAIGTLLGPQRAMLERLDVWSAANLLGNPERVMMWSELLRLKADVLEVGHALAESTALRVRADGLRAHVAEVVQDHHS